MKSDSVAAANGMWFRADLEEAQQGCKSVLIQVGVSLATTPLHHHPRQLIIALNRLSWPYDVNL